MEDNNPVIKTEAPQVEGLDVLSLIGAGSFGQVWKAKAKCCSEPAFTNMNIIDGEYHSANIDAANGAIAVKIFRRHKDLELRQTPSVNPLNEIYIWNRLSIDAGPEMPMVKSLGVGNTSAGERCLKIEFCTGGDLREFLNRRRNYESKFLTETEAAMVSKRVAKALHFCHKNCVLHLDVKPENILFRQSGNDHERLRSACLTDFSVALEMKNRNSSYMLCSGTGTTQYMAPEVAGCITGSSMGVYSTAADAWSLGVVLMESLTGLIPPKDKSECDYIKRDLMYANSTDKVHVSWIDNWMEQGNLAKGQRWTWQNGLSDDVKDVIRQLLEPNHRRRLTIDQFLRSRWLRQYQLEETVSSLADNGLMSQVKSIMSCIGWVLDPR